MWDSSLILSIDILISVKKWVSLLLYEIFVMPFNMSTIFFFLNLKNFESKELISFLSCFSCTLYPLIDYFDVSETKNPANGVSIFFQRGHNNKGKDPSIKFIQSSVSTNFP